MSRLKKISLPVLAALVFALVGVNAMTQSARADTNARCSAYANTAVAQHRRNLNNGCGRGGARWQSNWSAHYGWCRAVSRSAHRSETRARRRALRNCIGGGGGGPAARTFINPRIGGVRLDWCRVWAQQCGRPAANAYCRRRGYNRASNYRKAVNIGRYTNTRIISSGQICSGNFCDGFRRIRCSRW